MTKTVTIKSEALVFDDFFRIYKAQIEHERFDGAMQTVTRLCFDRGDSAAALIYNRDSRKIILIRQFKYPAYRADPAQGYMVEAVAGMVEPGERPEDAAVREIYEEVGYRSSAENPVTLSLVSTFFSSPGGTSERVFLYFAVVNDAQLVEGFEADRDEGEDIEIVEIDSEAFLAGFWQGGYADPKLVIAGSWLLSHREALA